MGSLLFFNKIIEVHLIMYFQFLDEGLGLNPILQDPALAIHPPILYLGYVGSSIIFSSVLAATTLKIYFKNLGCSYKKLDLSFMDFFNFRNFVRINLGLL